MKKDKSSPDPPAAPLKKKLITLLLLLHFSVILFNNLPHTALTYKLDDLYLWYMNLSGQYQKGWGMYNTPSHLNERFVISVYDTNDSDKSYSHHNITGSRELYLAEMIRYAPASSQTDIAQSYLKYTKKNKVSLIRLPLQYKNPIIILLWILLKFILSRFGISSISLIIIISSSCASSRNFFAISLW